LHKIEIDSCLFRRAAVANFVVRRSYPERLYNTKRPLLRDYLVELSMEMVGFVQCRLQHKQVLADLHFPLFKNSDWRRLATLARRNKERWSEIFAFRAATSCVSVARRTYTVSMHLNVKSAEMS